MSMDKDGMTRPHNISIDKVQKLKQIHHVYG